MTDRSRHWHHWLPDYRQEVRRSAQEPAKSRKGRPTPEEWDEVLARVSAGFHAKVQLLDHPFAVPDRELLQRQYELAMELFVRHFGDLWS